jgi:hypothetical protein
MVGQALNRNFSYQFTMPVATRTTEDENGLLVYQAAPTPIFRESVWAQPRWYHQREP